MTCSPGPPLEHHQWGAAGQVQCVLSRGPLSLCFFIVVLAFQALRKHRGVSAPAPGGPGTLPELSLGLRREPPRYRRPPSRSVFQALLRWEAQPACAGCVLQPLWGTVSFSFVRPGISRTQAEASWWGGAGPEGPVLPGAGQPSASPSAETPAWRARPALSAGPRPGGLRDVRSTSPRSASPSVQL